MAMAQSRVFSYPASGYETLAAFCMRRLTILLWVSRVANLVNKMSLGDFNLM